MVQVMKKTKTSEKVEKINPLSVREKIDIEREIQSIQGQLQEAKQQGRRYNISEQGIKDMQAEQKRKEVILAKDDRSELNMGDKNKIAARVKQLEELIMDGMCTVDEMRGGSAKYPGVVDKNMAHKLKTQHLQMEWKRLKRILEPDNPAASNVEILRMRLK